MRLPEDREGRGQRHRSFFEEGPNATGVHGEAQGDKTLTGQWLLGGGVLATSRGESPEVFAVTTTVSVIMANGWHRPGPPSLFLTETTLTPAQLCTPRDTHGEHTHACRGAYTQFPHQKEFSQLEQRPYPVLEFRRWWMPLPPSERDLPGRRARAPGGTRAPGRVVAALPAET